MTTTRKEAATIAKKTAKKKKARSTKGQLGLLAMARQFGARRTGKATVFSDLFGDPFYCFQLAQALCPDMDIDLEDVALLTINNVLVGKPYNDLGMLVGDKLLILVEAQATWTVNILIRLLLYLAQMYLELIIAMGWNVYGTKPIPLPMPESFVVYTGDRKDRPEELRLSTEFFGGKEGAVEVKVKVLYGDGEGDIIDQYVAFCHVLDDQYRKHGYTVEAVRETIRICRDQDVLKEYLSKREKEVIDIMLGSADTSSTFS